MQTEASQRRWEGLPPAVGAKPRVSQSSPCTPGLGLPYSPPARMPLPQLCTPSLSLRVSLSLSPPLSLPLSNCLSPLYTPL